MNYGEMKEMIRQEIVSIPVLEERILFKELMEQVFLDLYETSEKMYRELEQRVQEELAYDVNRYQIRTGIIERSCFDASHQFFSPMEDRDLKALSYEAGDIWEGIEKEGQFILMKIMLRCDYLQLKELWERDPIFDGVIETDSSREARKITVRLRRNTEYLQKVGRLYQLFMKNGIPWQTLNAPYLYKLADVVVFQAPEGIQKKEKIRQIRIDFGKYKDFVSYDMVPVWNVRKLILDGIQNTRSQKKLLLRFQAGREEEWLNRGIGRTAWISDGNCFHCLWTKGFYAVFENTVYGKRTGTGKSDWKK